MGGGYIVGIACLQHGVDALSPFAPLAGFLQTDDVGIALDNVFGNLIDFVFFHVTTVEAHDIIGQHLDGSFGG